MAFVSSNYKNHPSAPFGKWVCTRTSAFAPFDKAPPENRRHNPDFCGQCVSFVTTVCPTIPVNTGMWKKGAPVKGGANIAAGTAIATFGADGRYNGHAAIYEGQDTTGIDVVDQWVTSPATPIHHRKLRFGAHGHSNDGNNFFIVE